MAVPIVELWESLSAAPAAARGAAVLVARGAADEFAAACELPLALGASAALAELLERAGPQLGTVTTCGGCGEVMDVALALGAIDAATRSGDAAELVDGVVVRAPTTADLLAALDAPAPALALRERCVQWPDAGPRDPALQARVAGVAERLVGAAGVTVRIACPGCGRESVADVDVVGLLTDWVGDHARVVLAEVAELARAYGWAEREILALSPARRRTYLELARRG